MKNSIRATPRTPPKGNGLGPALVKRERLCRLLRLFRPALPLLCLSIVLCASALVLLFKWGLEDSAVSYPVYVIGLYLVVAWSISLPGAVRRLRAAMFASFGGGATFRRRMNAATSAGVCLLILFMAAAIVARAGRGVRSAEAAQGRAHEIEKE